MEAKDQGEKVIRTTCVMNCGEACGVLAHVKDGVLTKVEPADFPEPEWRYACHRSLSTPKFVYNPSRLKYPMKRVGERGEGKWQRISWDEAFDTITSRFKGIAAKYGPESVAVYTTSGLGLPNGAYWVLRRFCSSSGATWIDPYGCACSAMFCADASTLGCMWAESYLADFDDPRLYVLWGSNSAQNYKWKWRRRTRPAMEKGAKMVNISPLFTPTAAKADEWIPIRPGTDVALALGMINVILSEGLCDESFLIEHTVGPFLVRGDNGLFLREEHITAGDSTTEYMVLDTKAKKLQAEEHITSGDSTIKYMVWDTKTNQPQPHNTPGAAPALRGGYRVDGMECKSAFQLLAELAEQYPLEKASEITEVSPDVIRRLALDYVNLRPVVSERGLGLQRAYYGDLTYRAVTTLAAVTGNICLKRPEQDIFQALNFAGFMFPRGELCKQMSTFEFWDNWKTGKPWPIKALWVSSGNPVNSHQNSNNIKKALLSMEFTVVVDVQMSATAEYADILLPGCNNFECTNVSLPWTALYGGGNPYLQMQPKVIEPYFESKTDLEIFNELARRMGLEFFDKSEEEYIEMLISSGHPSMEGITLEKLKEGPVKIKVDSPVLFSTPSGRLEFYDEKLKEFGQELPVYIESPESNRQPLAKKYPLSFLQSHLRGRWHSHGTDIDWLRELEPGPVVDMNPVDAEKRDIQDGDMVVVFNDRGRVKLRARTHEGIRPGVVCMGEGWQRHHFAEGSCNELTSTVINPAQEAVYGSQAQIQGILVEVKKAEEV